MTPTGRARVEQDIVDLSVLVNTGLKGINAVLGVTERGPIGTTVLVGSWNEYVRHFGGLMTESQFPHYCKRALERGGKLRIARVAHYEDISDNTTLSGSKAKVKINGIFFYAKNIGEWGNNLSIQVLAASNGAAHQFDLKISLAGYPDLEQVIPNINEVLTASDVSRINAESLLVETLDTYVGLSLVIIADVFTGGTQDLSEIGTIDYSGDPVAGNGLYFFDNDTDFVKIAVPEMAIPEIDDAVLKYVDNRKDCRAVLRTPVGISGLVGIDYRDRLGVYDGSVAPDTWLGDMVFGELLVTNPKTGAKETISAIGDVLGAMSSRDNNSYEWFAVGGSKRGRLKNVLGVGYNLGSASRSTEFDQVDARGLIAVIDDRDFGPVIWGNSSLSKSPTLLKHSNVGDLLIFLTRAMSPLIRTELFDPNDIDTWKNIHRRVRPLLELIKTKRGIWDYLYQGDQLIDKIEEAQVNAGQNIDAGQYIFHLWIQPKVAMKYVGVKVIVTNSGVSFEELTGQPI